MKSLLLHINDDEGQESRLIAALAIAKAHDAHLTCIQVTPISDFIVTDPFGGMYQLKTLFEHLAKEAAETRARIEARLASERVEWDWSIHDGNVAGTIVSRSGLTDLIVLSQSGNQSSARKRAGQPLSLVADVAVHARTPVLAVPLGGSGFDPTGVAMIAWNGSPEAAHVVRTTLPMLRKARAVHIVTIDEDEDFPMDDVRRYLAGHGVVADCSEQRLNGRTVGEALCNAASLHKAAYIVMGAYGHSRLREAVLGGTSRHMLAHSPVPLLLAH